MPQRWKLVAAALALILALVAALVLLAEPPERAAAAQAAVRPGVRAVPAETETLAPAAGSGERTAGTAPAQQSEPEQTPADELTDLARTNVHTLRARVIDEAGQPIAGAELTLEVPDLDGSATSDAEGEVRLVLEREPLAEWLRKKNPLQDAELVVRANGYASRRWHTPIHDGHTTWLGDQTLEHGGVVRGVALEASEYPVEGAQVVATRALEVDERMAASFGPWRSSLSFAIPTFVTTTDASGAFEISGLEGGHWRLWAHTPDRLWTWSPPVPVSAHEPGTEHVLTLALRDPSRFISGTVFDPNGEPLPNVPLACFPTNHQTGLLLTDLNGAFKFTLDDPVPQEIVVQAPVWEWNHLRVEGISPGTHGLELRFEEATWYWVQVHDEQGYPVTSGRVEALHADRDERVGRSVSDMWPDGRARLHAPDAPFRIRVQAPGYAELITEAFTPESAPDPLRLTVAKAPALRGVVRADGKKVAGARVRLMRAANVWRARPPMASSPWEGEGTPFGHHVYPHPAEETRTRTDGEFVFKTHPGPEYFVLADSEGWATARAGPIALPSGQGIELDIELVRGGTLAGRLVLPVGEDAQGWSIRANDMFGRVHTTTVTSSGAGEASYELEHLAPGSWQVRAFRPGAAFGVTAWGEDAATATDVDVVDGGRSNFDIVVEQRSLCRLEGLFLLDDAPPGAWSAEVQRRHDNGSTWQVASDPLHPDGRFELEVEAGSEYELRLSSSTDAYSHLTITEPLELVPGPNSWELHLRTAEIAGEWDANRAQDSAAARAAPRGHGDGSVRSSFVLVTRPQGNASVRSWINARDGRFGPMRVPVGRCDVVPPSRNRWPASSPVLSTLEISAAGDRNLVLP